MIARIVTFSVERRWSVLLLTAVAAIAGMLALQRLPIDAAAVAVERQLNTA